MGGCCHTEAKKDQEIIDLPMAKKIVEYKGDLAFKDLSND